MATGPLRGFAGTRLPGEVAERETIEIVHVRAGRAVQHWGGRL